MAPQTSERFIESTGGFGSFQVKSWLITAFTLFCCSATFMVMVFSTAEPPWRCAANAGNCTLNGTFKPTDNNYKYRCQIARSDWEFAVKGDFDSTVTEWDLVCDKAIYPTIVNSLIFVTMLIGVCLGSILSDKFGRKTVAFPSLVFMCLCGFLSAFAEKYWVFALCRTLMGLGIGGYTASMFTLLVEFVGPTYRSRLCAGVQYAWVLACWTLALLGYLIQNWRTVSIIVSIPGVLSWIFWWFTPESLRWLVTKGKAEQAKGIFRRIAKENKKEITTEDIDHMMETCREEVAHLQRFGDIRDLFSNRTMTVRTLVSWHGWTTCGIMYYGIYLGAPSLGGNMYLNFFITSICEGLGVTISIFALDRFGRKKTIIVGAWVAAVAMVVATVLTLFDDGTKGYLVGKILSIQVVGMFSMFVTFNGLYLYSCELFPTVVRNTALGTSSAVARIGAIAVPFILYLVRVHPLLPCAIMASFPVVSGFLFLVMPETYNKAMPDNLQQVGSKKDQSESLIKVESKKC